MNDKYNNLSCISFRILMLRLIFVVNFVGFVVEVSKIEVEHVTYIMTLV